MKHIRIGKDISIRWEINTEGAAIPLQGRDLTLELKSPIGKVIILPFRVDGNVLTITYYGYEQTVVGEYSLTLWENKGKPGQNVVDAIRAFKLVRTSPEEADFIGGDLQVESVDLGTANLEILSGGGASTPGESPDLSALQGKVDANSASISQINEELDNKDSEIAQINTKLDEHTNSINATGDIVRGHTSEINAINTTISSNTTELSQIKTEQTEQNNRLADHEDRLVYTESDLVKVREEYNSIISELVKSIGHTQKAFVVETNDKEGYINIDGAKKTIPANSIKGFRFDKYFASGTDNNSGISSFRFLVTDTSEVSDMWYMFYSCKSLTSLDLSNFDTYKVTNMGHMFRGCEKLTSLDVSNFDTSKVTNMWYMFAGCKSLTSLDLSNFDTSKVTNMWCMFVDCGKLTTLDVSNFDTSKVTNMGHMFNSCKSLTSLDLSNFDTSKVTNMEYMFRDCGKLTTLDVSNFDTSKVTNMENVFFRLDSLTNLLLGPNFFKTSAVTIIDFSYCPKWTNETVITSLVTNSYDRASAGLNTLTLKLHANTKEALSDEQKATITSKGYTIA